ncbi:unnamed protein product, partial [Chrysoparadoxa australica]
ELFAFPVSLLISEGAARDPVEFISRRMHYDKTLGMWRCSPPSAWASSTASLTSLAKRVVAASPQSPASLFSWGTLPLSSLCRALEDELGVTPADEEVEAVRDVFGEMVASSSFFIKMARANAVSSSIAPGGKRARQRRSQELLSSLKGSKGAPKFAADIGGLDDDDEAMAEARVSAMEKLHKAAALFSSRGSSTAVPEIAAVKHALLLPKPFHEFLARTFKIKLSELEMTAMFEVFDADGNGIIDGAEFLAIFFKLTQEVRMQRLQAVRLAAHRRLFKARHNLKTTITDSQLHGELFHVHEDGSVKLLDEQVEDELEPPTDEEEQQLLQRIASHAAARDIRRCTDREVEAAIKNGSTIVAAHLPKLTKECFDFSLSAREQEVLFYHLRRLGGKQSGPVEAVHLTSLFYRLGSQERSKLLQSKRLETQGQLEAEAEAPEPPTPVEFTPEDAAAGLEKLRKLCAPVMDARTGTSLIPLELQDIKADPAPLYPAQLRSKLKRYLGLLLSEEEAWALVDHVLKEKELSQPFLKPQRAKKPHTVFGYEFVRFFIALSSKDRSATMKGRKMAALKARVTLGNLVKLPAGLVDKPITAERVHQVTREEQEAVLRKVVRAASDFGRRR